MKKESLPILEFDPCQSAFINPEDDFKDGKAPETGAQAGVICFFKEAIDQYLLENKCEIIAMFRSELISLPLYWDKKKNIILIQGYVGGPGAAAEIEMLQYLKVKNIITCGGAGVLNELAVGHLMIPMSAVRDEGASFHYAPPSYEIEPSLTLTEKITAALDQRKLPHVKGKTWTTDGPYRETKEKVNLRREEGCICVEMECASFYAVGQFRNVNVASILYGGDSLSGDEWDHRRWNERSSIRMNLLNTVMEIAAEIK